MPPVEFEPTISAGERPQTYALDRAATGTGISLSFTYCKFGATPWIEISTTQIPLRNATKLLKGLEHMTLEFR